MQSWDSSLLVCDVLQLFLGLTVSDFQYSLHFIRSVILEVRILLESEVIAMLLVYSYL